MPIIIKRYQNRKLYNTQTKKYINLEEIEDLIKKEQEIKVIDNLTGKDITPITLSQVIFEIEKNNSGFLPIKLLVSLVQSKGKRIDDIRRNIFGALSLFHHYDVEIERRINLLIEKGEISDEQGNMILEKLLQAGISLHENFIGDDSPINTYSIGRLFPTQNDFQSLIEKVDAMSQMIDEYSNLGQSL